MEPCVFPIPCDPLQSMLEPATLEPAGQAAEMPVPPTTNVFLFGERVARAAVGAWCKRTLATLLTSMRPAGDRVTVELAIEKTKGKAIGQVRT